MNIQTLRPKHLPEATGLSISTIRRLIIQGRFPAPISLSDNAVGWTSDVIAAWLDSRKAASPQGGRA